MPTFIRLAFIIFTVQLSDLSAGQRKRRASRGKPPEKDPRPDLLFTLIKPLGPETVPSPLSLSRFQLESSLCLTVRGRLLASLARCLVFPRVAVRLQVNFPPSVPCAHCEKALQYSAQLSLPTYPRLDRFPPQRRAAVPQPREARSRGKNGGMGKGEMVNRERRTTNILREKKNKNAQLPMATGKVFPELGYTLCHRRYRCVPVCILLYGCSSCHPKD